jgi:hypothetical protein
MRTSYKTTRELLEHFAEFYRSLSDFYETLENRADETQLKLLLDYLSDQSKRLEESINKCQKEVSPKNLDTWFQYAVEINELDRDTMPQIDRNTSVSEVFAETNKMHDKLANVYRTMSDRSTSAIAVKLFEQLGDYVLEEKKKLVRDYQQFQDVSSFRD